MPTLNDVAQFAGVSTCTVSRVLANKNYISDKTRQRVLEAVDELDYRPNQLAKSLKLGRSNTIALIIPSIQNQIFPDITKGVEDFARKSGFTVVLCNTDEDIEIEKEYIEKLRTRLTDGFIIASMTSDSAHVRKLRSEGFPVVLTGRVYDDSIDAVAIDNVQAAYDATRYLIGSGHQAIALAMGRQEISIYADRLVGYQRALEESGLVFDESLIMYETNGSASFYALTTQMLHSGRKIDAVLATSDAKALAAMRAILDYGCSIPDDISVMGIDNVEISALIEPPLTTVSQPLYDIGVLAAKRLIEQINHKEKFSELKPPHIDLLSTELIIRKSTRQ